MKELTIQETIDDIKANVDKLKEQLVYVIHEELNEFIMFKIKYYENIIDWLKELQEIKNFEKDDGK